MTELAMYPEFPYNLDEFIKLNPELHNRQYKEVEFKDMEKYNIMHLYPTSLLGEDNDGYVDSRMFKVWIFNSETKQASKCRGLHDEVMLSFFKPSVRNIRVYKDGSIVLCLYSLADTCGLNFKAMQID